MILSNNPQIAPIVSVVLCSYNREKTINQTIDSILNQKVNFAYELIIGDDGSKDNSRQILTDYQNKYPERITLIFQDVNLGLGGNWASCVKLARGKYIASCDDDDYWHNPYKLQLQVDYLENHPETGMVHTEKDDLNVITKKITPNVYNSRKLVILQGFIQNEIFSGKVPICVSTSMFRKDIIDKHVILDDYIRLRFNIQDWPTWVIISKFAKIDYLPISTCTYRIGHFAISNLQDYDKQVNKLKLDKQMYKYLCSMFPDNLTYDERGYDIYVNGVLLSLAYKRRDAKKAKEFARNMIALGDTSMRTRLSANWFGFWVFIILKKIRK